METTGADYYEAMIEERGYEPATFSLGGLSEAFVSRKFAFASNVDQLRSAVADRDRAFALFGVSMTGPPHVGTLGQILTALEFQAAGIDVEFVVADLTAYLGAGLDYGTTREYADRYERFIRELGFDDDAGRVRTHSGSHEALLTSMRLARYYDHDAVTPDAEEQPEPTDFERALSESYESSDKGAATSAFSRKQARMLLASDAVHPILEGDYEHVLFVGGAENSGLDEFFRRVVELTPHDVETSGLYAKLVRGLDGHPKMSKSIPESNLNLSEPPERLRDVVLRSESDGKRPETSLPYQMMRSASEYDPAELAELEEACAAGGDEWEQAKRAYAEYLVETAEIWKET